MNKLIKLIKNYKEYRRLVNLGLCKRFSFWIDYEYLASKFKK